MTWDDELIAAAATALDQTGDSGASTVAAAVRCDDGAICTGVNLFHFTGGPCAELVALANTAGRRPMCIVAVGDDARGVLPPCGRCRQVMLDLHPDIAVMLPSGSALPITDLLPHAYYWSSDS